MSLKSVLIRDMGPIRSIQNKSHGLSVAFLTKFKKLGFNWTAAGSRKVDGTCGRREKMKIVQTQEYLDQIREILHEGKTTVIPVSGISMAPFLHDQRDRVELCSDGQWKKGEIVLFQRKNGHYVLHRIIDYRDGKFLIHGDNTAWSEWADSHQIAGRVTRVCCKGKWIGPDSLIWKLYSSKPGMALWWRKAAGILKDTTGKTGKNR